MTIIHTNADGFALDLRPDGRHCAAVFIEDDLECSATPAITSITLFDGPGGASPTITGSTIVCMEPGRYVFRATLQDGTQAEFRLVACQRECLGRIGIQEPGAIVMKVWSHADKVMHLGGLANHADWFNGTAASMYGEAPHAYGG